jgi:hypothetical protein
MPEARDSASAESFSTTRTRQNSAGLGTCGGDALTDSDFSAARGPAAPSARTPVELPLIAGPA